jgi:hypothetical protein
MIEVPIPTLHLFLPLDQKLIELLKSLSSEEWNKPVVGNVWTVKDVAAHLLDGNMRTLAAIENFTGDPPDAINSHQDLVGYLNRLNADWVKAMKRVSPKTLIELLQMTQKPCVDYYHSLDPWATARFSVSWAGENESKNWFHIAREYTERWHHQQQIRDAVQKQGIMERRFFYPLIQTFMMALPYTYLNTPAEDGASIIVRVTGDTGGEWIITKVRSGWVFSRDAGKVVTTIELGPETSWKLFTKAFQKDEALKRVKISGNQELGLLILKMLSVMA